MNGRKQIVVLRVHHSISFNLISHEAEHESCFFVGLLAQEARSSMTRRFSVRLPCRAVVVVVIVASLVLGYSIFEVLLLLLLFDYLALTSSYVNERKRLTKRRRTCLANN